MRLINSDSEVVDARVIARDNGSANSNRLSIDIGAVAIAAALIMCLSTIAISVLAWSKAEIATQAAQRSEKFAQLTNYYLMDPHSRTPEELAAWAKFNREHEEK